jgi:hypothetical protein
MFKDYTCTKKYFLFSFVANIYLLLLIAMKTNRYKNKDEKVILLSEEVLCR